MAENPDPTDAAIPEWDDSGLENLLVIDEEGMEDDSTRSYSFVNEMLWEHDGKKITPESISAYAKQPSVSGKDTW